MCFLGNECSGICLLLQTAQMNVNFTTNITHFLRIPLCTTSFSKYGILGEASTDPYYSHMSGM